MTETHPGGCLCGAVRFEARGEPFETSYCHCRMCQRSSGAPAQVGASFPPDAVTWSTPPAAYRSSAAAERLFCPACGSQMAFQSAEMVSINVPCLDDPDAIRPRRHIWRESRIGWFEVADDLPRLRRDGE